MGSPTAVLSAGIVVFTLLLACTQTIFGIAETANVLALVLEGIGQAQDWETIWGKAKPPAIKTGKHLTYSIFSMMAGVITLCIWNPGIEANHGYHGLKKNWPVFRLPAMQAGKAKAKKDQENWRSRRKA